LVSKGHANRLEDLGSFLYARRCTSLNGAFFGRAWRRATAGRLLCGTPYGTGSTQCWRAASHRDAKRRRRL